jgi:hypothetical protein
MSSEKIIYVFTDPDPDKWWEVRTTSSRNLANRIQEKFPHLVCTETKCVGNGDSLLSEPSTPFSKIED